MAFGKGFPLRRRLRRGLSAIPLAKAQRTQSSQREEEDLTQRTQRRRGRKKKGRRIFTTEGNSELHGGHGVKKNLLYFFPIHASLFTMSERKLPPKPRNLQHKKCLQCFLWVTWQSGNHTPLLNNRVNYLTVYTPQKIKLVYGLLSALTLITGMGIYLLFRNVNKMILFSWISKPDFLGTILIPLKPSIYSNILRYNLPDMLWFIAAILFLRFIWFFK